MEAVAAGVPVGEVLHLTFREIFIILEAQQKRSTRAMQVALFQAWQTENLARHKKLPNLQTLLRKLEPVRVMSPGAIRGAIMSMAKALGAKVTKVRRGEF